MRECSGGGAGQLEVSVDLLAHVQIMWEGLYAPICNMCLLAWGAYYQIIWYMTCEILACI